MGPDAPMHEGSTDPAPPVVVPVIGVSQRCGTHALADLLAAHPDCRRPTTRSATRGGDWEDLLLEHADALAGYAHRTRRRWDPAFDDPAAEDRLLAALGSALARFAADPFGDGDPADGTPTHVVTKSPTTAGLHLLPRLRPDARPVLLVRDGADVVASARASFGGSDERWIRVWRQGARDIRDFATTHPGTGLVVRYEDLLADTRAVAAVCAHVGLDPDRLAVSSLTDLGVRGSSQTAAAGLHWRPEAPAEFRPVGRGAALPSTVRQRLGWLAGPELAHFGYDVPPAGSAAARAAGRRDDAFVHQIHQKLGVHPAQSAHVGQRQAQLLVQNFALNTPAHASALGSKCMVSAICWYRARRSAESARGSTTFKVTIWSPAVAPGRPRPLRRNRAPDCEPAGIFSFTGPPRVGVDSSAPSAASQGVTGNS